MGQYTQHIAGQENDCPVCGAIVKVTETPAANAGIALQRGVCANEHRLRRILQIQNAWQVDPSPR
jgi:hypothetical protein